jgi:hypothetical protein
MADTATQTDAAKKSLREQVQTQVVEMITKKLEEGTISEDRARSIAQLILEKLPEDISNEELMLVLPQLDDEFNELSDVVMPIIVEYEERVRKTVEERVLQLIKQQKFEEARKIAQKGINYSQQLSS